MTSIPHLPISQPLRAWLAWLARQTRLAYHTLAGKLRMAQAGFARQHRIVQTHFAHLAHAALLFKGHWGKGLLGAGVFNDLLGGEVQIYMHRTGDQVTCVYMYICIYVYMYMYQTVA